MDRRVCSGCITILTVGTMALVGHSDTTNVAKWDFSANPGATSPAAAADWFAGENWDTSPTAPAGNEWKAIVSGDSLRYISVGQSLTLGRFSALRAQESASPVIIGDFGITVDNGSSTYVISGGRIYAEMVFSAEKDQGFTGSSSDRLTTVLAGPIGGGRNLVLAGGVLNHRLDLYASSSAAVRTADFSLSGVSRGTGNMVTVGPRKGAAFSDAWTVVENSPFVSRTATTPRVAAGAIVTSPGVFPDGTFVKRIFDDNLIELSAPAEVGASGTKTLSFAAIDPVTTVTVTNLRMNSTVAGGGNFVTGYAQYDADGRFRVEVKNLVAGSNSGTVGTDSYYRPFTPLSDGSMTDGESLCPATIVIHDAALGDTGDHRYARALKLMLCNSHLEFAEAGRDGARSGLPDSSAASYSANSVTTITVTNGIDAAIGCVLQLTSAIVKDGAGSLELGLTNNVAGNTGTIVVKEGTVVLPAGSYVKTVAVSNGATLKMLGSFAPENFIVEPGARLAGPGTLVVAEPSAVLGSDIVYTDGAGVGVKGGSGEVMNELPTLEVVGDPAFHVDASVAASIVTKDGDGVHVIRWNDVRKSSDADKYLFATNVVNTPEIVKNYDGTVSHIFMQRYKTAPGATDLATQYDLVWSQAITNMRVIFQVQDCSNGGGQFLGMTPRLNALTGRDNDFVRDAGTSYAGDVFYHGNSGKFQKAVIAGDLHLNGVSRDPFDGYLYAGGKTMRGKTDYVYSPQIADVSPTLPVAADCFATDSGNVNRSGDKRICELIVYTNELTLAEKVAVRGYLMKKWINCDIDCAEPTGPTLGNLDTTGKTTVPRVDVAAGDTLVAESVTTDGFFSKGGDGTLQVGDFVNPSSDLTVADGILTLKSTDVSVDDIPSDQIFRMDATATDLMLIKEHNGVANAVRWWKSSHDKTSDWWCWGASTNPPTIKYDQLNGLSMVDFGEARYYSGEIDSSHMFFSLKNFKSVFMVANTAGGGNVVVGKSESWSQGGIMRGGFVSDKNPTGNYGYAQPLASTDGGTASAAATTGGARVRLNGTEVSPKTNGFSGGDDLLSWVSYVDIASDAYGFIQGHGRYGGGSLLGEYIAYDYGLNSSDALKVEAYLNKKWFNRTTAGCRPAVVSNLTVAAGATLKIVGGAPLTVHGSIAGAGSVEGSVKTDGPTRIDLTVASDGTLAGAVAVSGSLDLSAGGLIVIDGANGKLKGGSYVVVSAGVLETDASAWTASCSGADRSLAVRVSGNRLVLDVGMPGLQIIVR